MYDEVDEKCVPCPRGEFQDEHGRTTCKTCPDSTTTVGTGTQKKEQCVRMFPYILYSHLISLIPDVCPSGYFYDTSSKMCETCGLRGYQPKSGQDRCIPCPDGTVPIYQNSTTIGHCLGRFICKNCCLIILNLMIHVFRQMPSWNAKIF